MRNLDFETAFLRAALTAGSFSAVADRFGLWGPPGAPHAAWGDMAHFLRHVAILNPWASGRTHSYCRMARDIRRDRIGLVTAYRISDALGRTPERSVAVRIRVQHDGRHP